MIDTAFLDELASNAPTPGGGGAAAYCGALSAALASMVANLTVGKKKYADVEPQMHEALDRLAALRARLVELIDEDAAAFEPLALTYAMPRDTEEQLLARDQAQQKALIAATEVPLSIMETCVRVLDECDFLAKCGSKLALSDVGCAVVCGRAAVRAASLNVVINVGSLRDARVKEAYTLRMEVLLESAAAVEESVFAYVVNALS
ncbi:MAG: cyclodeaminase/cyclohydrolase family protein [Coriobacteriia bacterium]|nr:cyclodeaminase/cyclohydrolase family protein [Coriobacteriia bacterium]